MRNVLPLFVFLMLHYDIKDCQGFDHVTTDSENGRNGVRIIGGDIVTNRTQFAYQVSIRIRTDAQPLGVHFCGGSVISPKYVLSAAHCVVASCSFTYPAENFILVFGDLNLNEPSDDSVYRDVANVYTHPDYNVMTVRHDLSIFELADEVPIDGVTISIIPLSGIKPMPDVECVVSGWGVTSTDTSSTSNDLRYVNVEIVNDNVCRKTYNTSVRQFREDHLCAGYMPGGKGWCQGDSGGALVCEGKQVGVMSFGEECAAEDVPTIYANIPYFAPWIRIITGIRINSAQMSVSYAFVIAFGVLFAVIVN